MIDMSGPPEDSAPAPDPAPVTPWPTGTWAQEQPPAWAVPSVSASPPPPPPPPPPSAYPTAPPAYPAPPVAAPQAARPGVIPLRPLGFGEILDGAVSTMRKHWKVQLGLTAAVVVAITVVQAGTSWIWLRDTAAFDADTLTGDPFATDPTAGGSVASNSVQLIGMVIGLLAQTVLAGMLTVVVGRAVLGRDVSAGEAWAQVRPRVWRLIGLSILVPVMTLGLVAAAGLLPLLLYALGLDQVAAIILASVLLAAAIPAAIWLWVRFSVAAPAMILERAGVRTALRRSARLVRRSWWRVFGILLLIQIIAQLLASVLVLPFALLGLGLDELWVSGEAGTVWFFVLLMIGSAVGGLVTYPFTAGVSALLYVDLRMRREGLDLALARSAGTSGTP